MQAPDPELVHAQLLAIDEILTFRPELDVMEALVKLRDRDEPSGFVTDEDDRLLGVLSETDARRVLAQAAFYSTPTGAVREHMTTNVYSIGPKTQVFEIVGAMQSYRLRRVPVCVGERLVGVVTTDAVDDALWEMSERRSQRGPRWAVSSAVWDSRTTAERVTSRDG